MGAFDPLFRNHSTRFGRRPTPQWGGTSKLGALGLAGIGYGLYRFLKSERGQELQSTVIARIRELGGQAGAASQKASKRIGSPASIGEMSQP